MKNFLQHTLALVVCWLVVAGSGFYVTYVRQPAALEEARDAVKVERLKRAEVASLLDELAVSEEQAVTSVQQWNSRYKTIPVDLDGASVVGTLNELTQDGFDSFDVRYEGASRGHDVSLHRFHITGRGYFSSLYEFIWALENSRPVYRIDGLRLSHMDLMTEDRETGREQMLVMVSFTMNVEAYFGGDQTPDVPRDLMARLGGDAGGVVSAMPAELLPDREPDVNPFFPGIMEQLPPNTRQLIDVEEAQLVSIVGREAVFKDEVGYRAVGVGDAVYLGQIVTVEPTEERVVARLNKGGIIDEVELSLSTGERYRQALGAQSLSPASP